MKKVFVVALATLLLVPVLSLAEEEKCLTCHEGIEKISEVSGMDHLTCTDCHFGDATGTELEIAHKGMFANPSDLRVIDKTCGTCHPDEVANATNSLHATSAGIISGTRYAWGLQDRTSKYANYAVSDDKITSKNGVKSLAQVPMYDPSKPEGPNNSPADDYLRNQCLRCHIWSDGHQRDGDYRASGCAACHVVYSDNGTYEGGDKAIDKSKKDRPMFHRITSKVPETQCIHCHNRGGRTGVSYIGTIESDGYGTPWTESGGKQGKLHGKNYNHLTADIHYDKGMTCIDCHTKQDMHGNGDIVTKREMGVEIECEDCHGTMQTKTTMKTSEGNLFNNLKEVDGKIILTAKLTGKEHVVPQISEVEYSSAGYTAMVGISQHMERMECYSCHAKWAPQCYGCHAKQDIGKPNGDWLNGKEGGDPSMNSHKDNRAKTAFGWNESRSYVRWENPALGINSEGKISTFIPGCQVIFSQMDGDKNNISNKIYTTVDGTSGLGTNPIQPHTVTKEARTCVECHTTTKAVGLGGGVYSSAANGLPIDFELERIVDENGKQIQETSHEGARPFNKEELQRIMRTGTCVACHGEDDVAWSKMKGNTGIDGAPNDEIHSKSIRKILEKSGK